MKELAILGLLGVGLFFLLKDKKEEDNPYIPPPKQPTPVKKKKEIPKRGKGAPPYPKFPP